MSQIENQVLEQLRMHSELTPIERGALWKRGDDETRIWFEDAIPGSDEFALTSIAHIETIFGSHIKPLDLPVLGKLNRLSVFGNYFCQNGRVGIRASYSVYEKEPAANWVCFILLRALGEQLALGFGVLQSEFVKSSLPGNRANLEYPRRWNIPPVHEAILANAKRFNDRGLVSTVGPHGLVLEVPLNGGAPSRMTDKQAETALLHVSVDTPHPLAGVGYLATIALPIDPKKSDLALWSDLLNSEEHKEQDFVPRLGAWGIRGMETELVYSMFWPTSNADKQMDSTIMNWMVVRTLWLKRRFWTPGVGIQLEKCHA